MMVWVKLASYRCPKEKLLPEVAETGAGLAPVGALNGLASAVRTAGREQAPSLDHVASLKHAFTYAPAISGVLARNWRRPTH